MRPGAASMELLLPVVRDATLGTRHRLVNRMVLRRRERRALAVLRPLVVPEPVLAGLEGLHDGVLRVAGVPARVLRRRRIAAADQAAMCAPAEVEPPAVRFDTRGAAVAAGRDGEVDGRAHARILRRGRSDVYARSRRRVPRRTP